MSLEELELNAKVGFALSLFGIASVSTVIYGVEAVGTVIANEVKDEIASIATDGWSDFLDLTKGVKNLLEYGLKALKRGDSKALEVMDLYKDIDEVYPGCDCSEIAEDLFEQVGSGKVLELTSKSGGPITALQSGAKEEFTYHQIFVKDDLVYDPRYSSDPVDYDDYISTLKNDNGDIIITDVTPSGN